MSPNFLSPLVVKHLLPEGVFKGYASTQHLDLAKDKIAKGAFAKTLRSWKNDKKRYPYLYYQHDTTEPIGVCRNLFEDDHGLFVEGKLSFDFPKAHEAFAALERGINGLSIGFRVMRSSLHQGVRIIHELSLEEISFVPNPCNPMAQIQEYKSRDTQDVARKLQQLSFLLRSSY